jgi:hypothetical protein
MLVIVFALLVAVLLAAAVTVFAAYPHRGEPIPHADRLSEVMMKVNDRLHL